MKVFAINGSSRKSGNTETLIQSILTPARAGGVEIEAIFLGDFTLGACPGCEACRNKCRNDGTNTIDRFAAGPLL